MPVLNIETLDDPLLHELCADFSGGQSSFPKPDVIEQNQAAYIQNCYIHYSGQLRKRRGTQNLEDGFVSFDGKRIQGGCYYKNTIDNVLLAVSNGQIFGYSESTNTWDLFLSAGINNVNEQVELAQLSDDLFWTDSSKAGIRHWDGASIQTEPGTTPNVVENATILVSFTARLIAAGMADVPDGIAFSDFLDGSSWSTTNMLRVGAEGDPVVALKPWQDHFLLVFKEKSTWVIDVSPIVPVAQMEIKLVHSSIGCAAKRSLAQVGQDVFFLSRNGVMSVQKQLATSNNVVPVPVSYPLQDIMDAVNWEQAYKSCAVFYKNQYMLMLPVADIEPETAIVYSFLQQSWAGVWTGPKGTFLMEQPYQGSTRLIIGTDMGEVKTARDGMNISEDLPETFIDAYGAIPLPVDLDVFFPQGSNVESVLITRAMFFGEAFNPKSPWYMEAEFQARDSDVEIYAILDGTDPVLLDQFTMRPTLITLPADLTFDLQPARWLRRKYPLFQLGRFRSIQIKVLCPRGNMILRSIYLCSFLDSIELDQRIQVL